MTLVLSPLGRGRWHRITVVFNGRRAPRDAILRYRKGDVYELDGVKYRIVGVFT